MLWTEEGDGGVWFRARVKEVDEASMTVEYTHVGEGWKDFVHKWGDGSVGALDRRLSS